MKDVLTPVQVNKSTSKVVENADCSTKNWRQQGQPDVNQAVADNPTKKPICPVVVKK